MIGPITILGVDPALTCTGYGLLRADGDRYEALDFGAIAPPAQAPIAERLLRIHEALSDVIRDARPDEVAVEDFIVGHVRSEEHTSELQSHHDLVCRLLLEKKKKKKKNLNYKHQKQ